MTRPYLPAAACAVLLFMSGYVQAAAISMPPAQPSAGWQVSVGAAGVFTPLFSGDDEYGLSIVPDIRASYGDRFFASIPEGIGYNAVLMPSFKAGPLVKLRFGREEDRGGSSFLISGSTDDLRGMGDIDPALEWGGFAELESSHWKTRLELRQGSGGHEGWVADVNFSLTGRQGPARYALGPRLTLASRDFVQTYYGVDAAQAAASGLKPYSAQGGLVSAGLGASFILPFGKHWSLAMVAGYDHLLGDAGDSPLVTDRGSANQFSLIGSVSYRF